MPCEREAIPAEEVEHPYRGLRRARADDLHAHVLHPLQRLAPGDEGREHQIAERPVFVQQGSQHVAIDGDVPQRLGHDRRQERRLSGEEAQFAEELRLPVAHDLVAARVEDRHLTLEYRDERITRVADTKQGLAHVRGPIPIRWSAPTRTHP